MWIFRIYWTPGLPKGVLCNHPCLWSVRPSVRLSVFKYLRDRSKDFSDFGPRFYPRGSYVITHVRPSVVRPSVGPSLNISETALRIFLIFCMKLVHHKGTKVTEPDFEKNLGGSQMGENPHFWGIFDIFCPYLKNSSKDFDEILRFNSPQ